MSAAGSNDERPIDPGPAWLGPKASEDEIAMARPRGPGLTLRAVLPMLAGLAPVHHERLRERGGWVAQPDDLFFLDTSSYGPRAIDAVMRVIGLDHIVFGSDHPVVALQPDAYIRGYGTSLLDETAHRLLGGSLASAGTRSLTAAPVAGATA